MGNSSVKPFTQTDNLEVWFDINVYGLLIDAAFKEQLNKLRLHR